MKIYGICLIKNEEDIILYCLNEASKWADKIIVYDNGSTDSTWKIVNELALSNTKIVPWKQDAKPYHDGLRGEVFNAFKHELNKGDWWAILDADEFFMENPKEFLSKVPWYYQLVKTKSFEYLVTIEDVEEYSTLYKNHFPEDLPLLKYYKSRVYSENRFMRHRPGIKWNPEGKMKWPKYSGISYPDHIPLKHYQYRSPYHIQKRIQVRKNATSDGYRFFKRDLVDDWRMKLIPRSEAILETNEMRYKSFFDSNVLPWYRKVQFIVLHALRIWP